MSYTKFKTIAALLLTLTSIGCATDVAPTNPFDPEAPTASQEPASITGIVELEGRDDHSGIEVRLDGYSGNSAITDETGAFTLANLASGISYMVVASYEREVDSNFESIRVSLESNLRPGETRVLATQTLAKAPAPPVVIDAQKSGDTSITVYWVKSPEPDVISYQIYYRTSSNSAFQHYDDDCDGSSDSDILSCVVHGLSPFEQYSFKVTATDTDGIQSSYSVENIFQYLFLESADESFIEDNQNHSVSQFHYLNSEQKLLIMAVNNNSAIIRKYDPTNNTATECIGVSFPEDDENLVMAIAEDSDFILPETVTPLLRQHKKFDVYQDTNGQMHAVVFYEVQYMETIPTIFSGFATLDLSLPFNALDETETCVVGNWKHTLVPVISNANTWASFRAISTSQSWVGAYDTDNEMSIYHYDIENGQTFNPELLWEYPGQLTNGIIIEETLVALDTLSSRLLIGNTSTLEHEVISTVAWPRGVKHVANSNLVIVTGRNAIAVVNIENKTELSRVSTQVSNAFFPTLLPVPEELSGSFDAMLYVAHFDTFALSIYGISIPSASNPSPGFQYLTPMTCSGTCSIYLGLGLKDITTNSDGSKVFVIESNSQEILRTFHQPAAVPTEAN